MPTDYSLLPGRFRRPNKANTVIVFIGHVERAVGPQGHGHGMAEAGADDRPVAVVAGGPSRRSYLA